MHGPSSTARALALIRLIRAQKIQKRLLTRTSPTREQSHTDIPSFLRYSHLSGLNPTKTVFTGTLYEYTVLSALSRLLPGVSLTRIGGRDDAGVDLEGTWELPKIPRAGSSVEEEDKNGNGRIKLPLIIQCKNVRDKGWKGPQYVRELEGALANRPADALGILASVRDMTPGMKKQMLASRRALGFIKVTPLEGIYQDSEEGNAGIQQSESDEESDGEEESNISFRLTGRGGLLQQFAWNEVANRFIGGFGIGARYVPRNHGVQGLDLGDINRVTHSDEDEVMDQEITLTWNGSPVSKP